jgi:hypothetical protein
MSWLSKFMSTAHNELWRFALRSRSEENISKYLVFYAAVGLVVVEIFYIVAAQCFFLVIGGSPWWLFQGRSRILVLYLALLLAHRIFLPKIFVPRLPDKNFDSVPLTKEIVFARMFLSVGPITSGVLALYGYAIHYKPL